MKFHHVSYIQTVHILYIPLHISLTHEKSSYQTVIPSSDGMLNASTDSVHVNIWWCTCVHTKRKHTRFPLSPRHTHTNTFTQPHLDWAFLFFFYTNVHTHQNYSNMRPVVNTAESVPDPVTISLFCIASFLFFLFIWNSHTHNFNTDDMSLEWGKKKKVGNYRKIECSCQQQITEYKWWESGRMQFCKQSLITVCIKI